MNDLGMKKKFTPTILANRSKQNDSDLENSDNNKTKYKITTIVVAMSMAKCTMIWPQMISKEEEKENDGKKGMKKNRNPNLQQSKPD